MSILNRLAARSEGARKAHRDCQLVEEFFAEHNYDFEGHAEDGTSKHDIGHRFVQGLGMDVNRKDSTERWAYLKSIGRWKLAFIKAHPEVTRHALCWFTTINPAQLPPGHPTPQLGVEVEVVSFPLDAIANSDDPAKALMQVLGQAMGFTPEQIEAASQEGKRQARKMNLEAGRCLACGGGITADGDCDGPEDSK